MAGASDLDNLALACWICNLKKGPNLAGIDPLSGQLMRLFNPRKDLWAEHFTFGKSTSIELGIEIRGLTTIGRTTVDVLPMNTEVVQLVRYHFRREL
jgi:hypothetical protein